MSEATQTMRFDRPGTKGTINLRIEAHTRQLIDDAAAIVGKTRTDFMIESAREMATGLLLDRRMFALTDGNFDGFVQALETSQPVGPKLTKLLTRAPVWSKK
jgi:uncharacterized protein (DUF1778 family)